MAAEIGSQTFSKPAGGRKIPVQALLAAPLAVAVFVADTDASLRGAIAVLYSLVIMMAASALHGRRLVLVALGCSALTVVAYVMDHGFVLYDSAFVRAFVSLCAIAGSTWLVLQNQAASEVLRSQAALLDLTHDAVFVWGLDGAIRFWNRGAEQLYGWSPEEAVGKTPDMLLHTTLPEDRAAIMADLLRDGRWEGELVQCARNGAELVVESRWALQRGDDGAPVAVLETNTDITARKEADTQLEQAHSELARASRLSMLGQFTATLAHELNQPLGAIATNGEAALRFMNRPQPDLPEVRGALERMIAGATRASDVVMRIRAMLRRDAPERSVVEIPQLVEEASLLIQRDLQARRIELQLDIAPDLPPVLGDRVQLQQVLINLLVNGLQAMSETKGPRRLTVVAQGREDHTIVVQVRDTGLGIAEADMDRLFGTFFTTKSDGMGLGLAICRSIIEGHGGRIRAAAPDGPGALIEFSLPAAAAAAKGEAA